MSRQDFAKGLWKSFQQLTWNFDNSQRNALIWNTKRNFMSQLPVNIGITYVSRFSRVNVKTSKRFIWTWRKSIENADCIRKVTPKRLNFDNINFRVAYQCRCLSQTSVLNHRKMEKKELPDKKAKLAKVFSVWKNMTVAELSRVLRRPEGVWMFFFTSELFDLTKVTNNILIWTITWCYR